MTEHFYWQKTEDEGSTWSTGLLRLPVHSVNKHRVGYPHDLWSYCNEEYPSDIDFSRHVASSNRLASYMYASVFAGLSFRSSHLDGCLVQWFLRFICNRKVSVSNYYVTGTAVSHPIFNLLPQFAPFANKWQHYSFERLINKRETGLRGQCGVWNTDDPIIECEGPRKKFIMVH